MDVRRAHNVLESGVPGREGPAVRPRFRVRPEHVALRRTPLRGTTTGWSCSTTWAPAARSAPTTPSATPRSRATPTTSSGSVDDAGPARRGLRRPLGLGDDRRPRPSPGTGQVRGPGAGRALAALHRRRRLHGRLRARRHRRHARRRLSSNYLGWSSAMAPVIMGNSDRAGARRRADAELLPSRPRHRRALRPGHLPVRQPVGPAEGLGPDPGHAVPRRRHRADGRGRVRRRRDPRQHPGASWRRRGHCPNLSAPDEVVEALEPSCSAAR